MVKGNNVGELSVRNEARLQRLRTTENMMSLECISKNSLFC